MALILFSFPKRIKSAKNSGFVLFLLISVIAFFPFSNGIQEIGAQETDPAQKSNIFGLKVKSGEAPGDVSLNWNVREDNNSPIIVKRYSRPMSTIRLLRKGEQVNAEALDPQTKNYTDKLSSPGVYYYAVVTEEELDTPERLALVKRGNYSNKPFILTHAPKPADTASLAPEEDQGHPQELIAVNAKKSVVLSWAPISVKSEGLRYEIYRSSAPLNTKEALGEAKLIGKTQSHRPQFEDKAPVVNEDVYYAVIVSGALQQDDFKALELGKSYIKHRYLKELAEIDEIFAVNTKDSVLLTWTPRGASQKTRYHIYRSPHPLNSKEALERAFLLGKTKNHRPQFRDEKPLPDRDLYYGALVIEKGKEPKLAALVFNKSYLKHRFIPEKKAQKTIFALSKKGIRGGRLLDLILAQSYLKGRYKQCIRQVDAFLEHTNIGEDTEAKGNFFLGLCHYKAKSYSLAMEFFSVPLVKKKYPVRSRFWFERSVRRP